MLTGELADLYMFHAPNSSGVLGDQPAKSLAAHRFEEGYLRVMEYTGPVGHNAAGRRDDGRIYDIKHGAHGCG